MRCWSSVSFRAASAAWTAATATCSSATAVSRSCWGTAPVTRQWAESCHVLTRLRQRGLALGEFGSRSEHLDLLLGAGQSAWALASWALATCSAAS